MAPCRWLFEQRMCRALTPCVRIGVYAPKKAVVTLGLLALPSKSTALSRALHEWRDSLIADLGGVDTISTQQATLVEIAIRDPACRATETRHVSVNGAIARCRRLRRAGIRVHRYGIVAATACVQPADQ